jgi:hypothetical protein
MKLRAGRPPLPSYAGDCGDIRFRVGKVRRELNAHGFEPKPCAVQKLTKSHHRPRSHADRSLCSTG